MTLASRDLNGSLVFVFHKDFAEQLLPALCGRLEQARALAMAGRTVEAGRKYQALLVSSQVLAFAVAVQSMAQYADRRLEAGGQISVTQQRFADEASPILEAALSEDPRSIELALNAHPEMFARWAALLEEWPVRIDDGAHKAKVAMVVWDIAFLIVATYEAAGAAAEIVAAGRPPIPPLPAFATAGGAAATGYSGPAVLELAETLRRLIALGVLDAGVVAALSRPLMSALQMEGNTPGHGTAKEEETPSIRSRLRDAGLPGGSESTQTGPFRYRPPDGYKPGNPLPKGRNGGYLDRFGNEWQKGPYHGDPSRGFGHEWDVQLSKAGRAHFQQYGLGEKGYIDVAPDGTLSH